MPDVHREDMAYAAGIIDGEGTIGVTELAPDYEPSNRKRRRKNPQHRVYVAVVMSDPGIPLWLRETFGGYANTYEGRQAQHKPITRWSVANKAAAEFCREIAPFLKLKRSQAELVTAFYYTHLATNRRSKGIPPDELAARREATSRIRELNRRGLVVSQGGA